MQLPNYLEQGEPARLLPVGSQSNKERRVTSTLLGMFPILPELAEKILQTIGFRLGRRARVTAYTEVVFKGTDKKDRPDGLLIVEQGSKTFAALIEAKVDKAPIDADQLQRYLKIAADNAIDAVVTISNQFVSNATISPVRDIPKPLLRRTQLYHWSWISLLTQCQLLASNESIEEREKQLLLDELIRFLAHPSTGIETFSQMNAGWKDVVKTVSTGGRLSTSDENLLQTVDAWIQEERDLSLLLSRVVKQPVNISLSRKMSTDPAARRKAVTEQLLSENRRPVTSVYRMPWMTYPHL